MTEDELDLPPPESRFVDEQVALERIEALTTTARRTWLVLIGFLALIGLTLLSVRDVDFFSVSATTDLPIVNIAIPTTTFFWTASLLAAVLHTYFHIFLLQLWDALAEAPPEIDRLNLGDRVFPWLVNSWALRRRKDRPVTRRPMGLLSSVVTGIVIWLATPIVLAGFWWWSLPAHDARVSLAIAAALWISLFASMRGWRRARRRLAQPGLIAKQRQNQTIWQRLGVARRGFVTLLLWLLILAGVPLLAVATVAGTGGHHLTTLSTCKVAVAWLGILPARLNRIVLVLGMAREVIVLAVGEVTPLRGLWWISLNAEQNLDPSCTSFLLAAARLATLPARLATLPARLARLTARSVERRLEAGAITLQRSASAASRWPTAAARWPSPRLALKLAVSDQTATRSVGVLHRVAAPASTGFRCGQLHHAGARKGTARRLRGPREFR